MFTCYFVYVATCGGTYPQYVTLDIASPNYPRDYPHDTSCLWIIPFTKHQEIVLTISDIQLEDGYDTLTVHSDSGVHQFTGKCVLLCYNDNVICAVFIVVTQVIVCTNSQVFLNCVARQPKRMFGN